MISPNDQERYLTFSREQWSVLRAQTSLTLTEKELEAARGINDRIDLEEVATVYLPLTRLLNLYVAATQNLHRARIAAVVSCRNFQETPCDSSAHVLQALRSDTKSHLS